MADKPGAHDIRELPVEVIVVGERLRGLEPAKVADLIESIGLQGLLQPLVVAGEPSRLVAGAHRLAAVKMLGWTTVPAVVLPDDDLFAQLAEVDENVVRNDLNALERGEHLLRRDEVLEALGRRAQQGGQPGNTNAKIGGDMSSPPSDKETNAGLAGRMGTSVRHVQRLRGIARALSDQVRDLLRPTAVAHATGVLEQLARIDKPKEQLALAQKLAAGEAKTVNEARRLLAQQKRARKRRQAVGEATLVGTPGEGIVQAPEARLMYGEDVRVVLDRLPEASIHSVVTSPPYFQVLDYEVSDTVWSGQQDCRHRWQGDTCKVCGAWKGQLGWEPTPDDYARHLVEVFRGIRRVLRPDGSCWLNLGDSYASAPCGDAKPKDLMGVPWLVAHVLQADGWYVRSEVIWSKGASGQTNIRDQAYQAAVAHGVDEETARAIAADMEPFTGNSLPQSAPDRPARTHEHVFLLTREKRYFYDAVAIAEQALYGGDGAVRQLRSTWQIPRSQYDGEHFAPMPPVLALPCVLAGTSEAGACAVCGAPWERVVTKATDYAGWAYTAGKSIEETAATGKWSGRDGGGAVRSGPVVSVATKGWSPTCGCGTTERVPCVVLDPFSGSGTTGMVALEHGRSFTGVDLQTDFLELAKERMARVATKR